MSNQPFSLLKDKTKRYKKKPNTYEETLSPEELNDLNIKLHKFWESLARKHNYRIDWNTAAKYRKRVK